MRPETMLYVEVPHEEVVRLIDDPAQCLEHKRHWHEHINFFTTQAIEADKIDVLDGEIEFVFPRSTTSRHWVSPCPPPGWR